MIEFLTAYLQPTNPLRGKIYWPNTKYDYTVIFIQIFSFQPSDIKQISYSGSQISYNQFFILALRYLTTIFHSSNQIAYNYFLFQPSDILQQFFWFQPPDILNYFVIPALRYLDILFQSSDI